MDKFDRSEENITQDIPKVPIKTYRWEDVKRSRRKGAYPWTHLSKAPFDEEIDQEEYTMDAFRRSRSTSTLGKSENQDFSDHELQLKEEISTDNFEKQFEASKSDENNVSKLEASSSKHTINIENTRLAPSEDKNIVRSKSAEPRYKRKISIESGKSGASVSKLGLMDKFKSTKNKLLKRSKSDASDSKKMKKGGSGKNVATKTTKSRLAPVKDESPVYIHIPLKLPPGETDEFSKYEFESPGPSSHSASLTKLQNVGSGQRKMSLMGILAELKKVQAEQQKQKLAAKATESIENNKDSQVQNVNELNVPPLPPTQSEFIEAREEVHTREPTIELLDSTDSASSNNITENKLNIEEISDTSVASTSIKYSNSDLETNKTFEPVVNEPEENSDDDNISQYLDKDDNYEQISEKSTNISSENLSKVEEINKQSKQSLHLLPDTKPASPNTSEIALSKWKQLTPSTKLSTPKTYPSQRAKSEEPKRKRRSSIDSGHSRKSLSKLALAKRFKEATDKIKLPKLPSFAKLNKKSKSKSTENVKKKTASDSTLSKSHARQYPEKPVYIHIPLKPPPGTTDEFSSLEEKDVQAVHTNDTPEVKEKLKDQISVDSSDTTDANIQFIYLTAPSDDELLDANIPETPSESDKKFFENLKEDDLKVLAKSAMKTVYPETTKLETVTEDEANSQHNISAVLKLQVLAKNALEVEQTPAESLCKIEEVINPIPAKTEKEIEEVIKPVSVETEKEVEKLIKPISVETEKIFEELIKPPPVPFQINKQSFIDEEDGLKLSDAAIAMINEEMAKEAELMSNPKSESSPSLKKKVSFKGNSDNGDSIYEDLELSSTLVKSNIEQESASSPIKGKKLETFQSMSVEEEKSYLDKDVIKTTSLDEDYNKWSPLNDHEYEPVNPPPEDIPLPKLSMHPSDIGGPPKRHVVEFSSRGTENKNASKENVSAQEVQNMMEEYFVKTPPKTLTPILKETSKTSQISKEENISSKKEHTATKSFNDALKNQAGKIKSKLQKFTNASIKLPPAPKFTSTKLKKPKFTMPKMPQRPSLSSLGIVRKNSSKDSWKERQFSTESNVSSSTGNIFDFRTFPRIFKKDKRKASPSSSNRDITPPPIEFATVPRMSKKKNTDSSWTRENKGDDSRKSKEYYKNETKNVIRIPLHSEDDDSIDLPSHTQYREDIDVDDDYNRENINRDSPFSKDYLKRWDHGEFHENPQLRYVNESDSNNDFNTNNYNNNMEEPNTITKEQYDNEIELASGKEEHSSGSFNERRQGVLEEIDSDEFFLREKGISQENIEVGKYLSSEIREAFRNPANALSQFQSEDREYDLEVSDQSEPSQNVPKRKPLRKPKRKKTPHVSREQISFDHDSVITEPDEYLKTVNTFNINETPTRPKRKSNKKKKSKPATEDVIPYQETIPIDKSYEYPVQDDELFNNNNKSVFLHHTISDSDLQGFYENELQQQMMYENEFMQGIEQPEIQVSDLYNKYENFQEFQKDISDFFKTDKSDEPPIAPKRKQRSLKSLTVSEPEANVEKGDLRMPQNEVELYRSEEYIIPTPEPPKRSRKRRSRTHSPSVISQEDEMISRGESLTFDAPIKQVTQPLKISRKRRSRTHSPSVVSQEDETISRGGESLTFDAPMEQFTQPHKISRKRHSRTHSPSIISQQADDRISNWEDILILNVLPEPVEEPTKPKRRSRTHSPSIITRQEDDRISCDEVSLILDESTPVVVEEVCVQELCDHMGYAVINKSRKPEPPLPPPRFPATPPARRKRKNKQKNLEDKKFSTVPRSVNDNIPTRPLRNYSTLGGSNSSHRSKSSLKQDEEKENIDVRQYAEIDNEEPVKHLQSGEVIKKMKDRPLPAPPRPPRKSKEFREVFRDISHERNIPTESQTDLDKISTNEVQMESEIDHDAMLANIENEILSYDHEETVTHGSLVIQPINNAQILPLHELTQNRNNSGNEIVRIIPIEQTLPEEIINDNELNDEDETSYIPEEFKQLRNPEEESKVETNDYENYDETSEIPEEFKQLKDPEEITSQTDIPKSEEDYEVTTEIPEEFTKLKSPTKENLIDRPASTIASSNEQSQSLGVLKAEKLQVQNLDVDKLRVNELQATKIIVSELDGVSLQVKEINSKSGNLVISGIELPPQLIHEMLDQLQAAAHSSFQRTSSQTAPQESEVDQPMISKESDIQSEENKAPCESSPSFKTENPAEVPPVPPRYDSKTDLLDENLINIINFESESSKLHQVVQHQDSEEQVDSNQQEPDECYLIDNPPTRPPRKSSQIIQNIEDCIELPINVISSDLLDNSQQSRVIQEEIVFTFPPMQESLNFLPHSDSSKSEEEPPPRPPQPLSQEPEYIQSQPPLSFYSLRSPQFIEFIEEDIPLPPRRKRHHKSVPRSKSSSDDSVVIQRRHRRSSETSIPRLTGQLVRACTTEMERSIKRLISHFRNNVLQNADGQQDSHVMILILLILIAGLILLSCDEKINIHHHHWEYFNPPKDL